MSSQKCNVILDLSLCWWVYTKIKSIITTLLIVTITIIPEDLHWTSIMWPEDWSSPIKSGTLMSDSLVTTIWTRLYSIFSSGLSSIPGPASNELTPIMLIFRSLKIMIRYYYYHYYYYYNWLTWNTSRALTSDPTLSLMENFIIQ